MWQQILKSHRMTTKVVATDKCLLAAFKAALVFISIIVMPVVASLNLILVSVVAAVAIANFLICLRWCNV